MLLIASTDTGAMPQVSWRHCCCGLPQLLCTHEQQCSSDSAQVTMIEWQCSRDSDRTTVLKQRASSNAHEPCPTISHVFPTCLTAISIIPIAMYTWRCVFYMISTFDTSQLLLPVLNWRASQDLPLQAHADCCLCCGWLQEHVMPHEIEPVPSFPHALPLLCRR